MPIFDYECSICHRVDEVLVRDRPFKVIKCPTCGLAMRKQMPAPGLLRTNFHDKPSVRAR